LLDLTSDFKGLKKQRGNDIYEGKRTIMLMHLFGAVKGADKKRLLKIMAKERGQKNDKEISWVVKMMEKYGSLDYGKKLAESLASRALDIFGRKLDFLKKSPARDQLKAGINFILHRNY
jgi:geranylgeranyl diphosphate synthase type II